MIKSIDDNISLVVILLWFFEISIVQHESGRQEDCPHLVACLCRVLNVEVVIRVRYHRCHVAFTTLRNKGLREIWGIWGREKEGIPLWLFQLSFPGRRKCRKILSSKARSRSQDKSLPIDNKFLFNLTHKKTTILNNLW